MELIAIAVAVAALALVIAAVALGRVAAKRRHRRARVLHHERNDRIWLAAMAGRPASE